MKKNLWLPFLLMFSLILSGCSEDGIYSLKVILGGHLEIPTGAREKWDILLLDGSLNISEGGTLEGSIYQLLGTLNVDGTVGGDVLQWSGDLLLGHKARIDGDYSQTGGTVVGYPEETVAGEINYSDVQVPLSPEWFDASFKRQVVWAVIETIGLSLFAIFLGWAFPAPLERVRNAVRSYPLVSGAIGLLAGIVGLVLIVQMIFTILLIPVSLLGLLLLALSIAVGWTSFGLLIGRWLCGKLGKQWPISVEAGIGTFLFIGSINLIVLLIGAANIITFATAVIGLGAVFLTRLGLRQFVPASAP